MAISAIEAAEKEYEKIKEFEASLNPYAIYPIGNYDRKISKQFLERINNNSALAAACKKVEEKKMLIHLFSGSFWNKKPGKIRSGMIYVNVSADDRSIVKFLLGE